MSRFLLVISGNLFTCSQRLKTSPNLTGYFSPNCFELSENYLSQKIRGFGYYISVISKNQNLCTTCIVVLLIRLFYIPNSPYYQHNFKFTYIHICAGVALKDGDNCEYVTIYEDKDGDWMLAGDVPWGYVLSFDLRYLTTKRKCITN